MRSTSLAVAVVVLALVCALAVPERAAALDPCGLFGGIAGKACGVVTHPGQVLGAAKNAVGAVNKVANGRFGAAAKQIFGGGAGGAGKAVAATAGLAALGAWVVGGAQFALKQTAALVSATTRPRLTAPWFSARYVRIAAIAALLTVPFLCAAAIQALLASDPAMLARAVFQSLPIALVGVWLAAPLVTLLLSATDEMSGLVSSAAGAGPGQLLGKISGAAAIGSIALASPFMAFLIGSLAATGALVLWIELALRDAAVYVVVLMLPLTFAAMVWPARRMWAVRAVEVLVAVVLAKFAIVAILSLGATAFGSYMTGLAGVLPGLALLLMATFAPWATLRFVPLAELGAGALHGLRGDLHQPVRSRWDSAPRGFGAPDSPALPAGTSMGTLVGGGRSMQELTTEMARDGAAFERRQGGATSPDTSSAPSGPPATPTATPTPSATPSPPPRSEPAPPRERLPGMDPIWQLSDGEWNPITLGLGEGWPPDPMPADQRPPEPPPPEPHRSDQVPEPPEDAAP